MKHKQNSTTTTHSSTLPTTLIDKKKAAAKKITNWNQYNKALVRRGNISLYVTEAAANRVHLVPPQTGKAGHPKQYSDDLIIFILTIRELFHLPLRQSLGVVGGLLSLAGLDWQLPDFSTLSRRMGTLTVDFCPRFRGENVVFLLDSSGFKVFGEGEWKVRKHGLGYRRTWRETHLAIDFATRNVVSLVNTKPSVGDSTQLVPLLDGALEKHRVTTIIGDGAYDAKDGYLLARELGVTLIVPPPKNATEHLNMYHYQLYDQPNWKERNEVVRRVDEVGLTTWKQEVGYHRRSLVENTFYRFKQLFGANLKSRTEPAQYTEQCIRASLLNRFNEMGLPTYVT